MNKGMDFFRKGTNCNLLYDVKHDCISFGL